MIQVYMLGKFHMVHQQEEEEKEVTLSTKMSCLFAYLLCHRGKVVTKEELIENFFGDGKQKNPESALKTAIFRLRESLNQELGENTYILSSEYGYEWNEDAEEIVLDVDTFEQSYRKSKSCERNRKQQIQTCRETIELYTGKFLKGGFECYWRGVMEYYLNTRYIDIVLQLIRLYREEGDWTQLELVCEFGLQNDRTIEELHYYLVLAKIKLSKGNEALFCYQEALRNLEKSVGARTDRVRSLWKQIVDMQEQQEEKSLAVIQREIQSKSLESAFVCNYAVFCEICRVENCRLEQSTSRTDIQPILMLISLKRNKPTKIEQLNTEQQQRNMDRAEQILKKYLHVGDVIARCSQEQFIVLLYNTNIESCAKIATRIRQNLKRSSQIQEVEVFYETLKRN